MKTSNIFLFMTLKERNGDYEYFHKSVHILSSNFAKRINSFANNYIKSFYEGNVESGDDGYYFHGRMVFLQLYSYSLISEEQYNILSQYI